MNSQCPQLFLPNIEVVASTERHEGYSPVVRAAASRLEASTRKDPSYLSHVDVSSLLQELVRAIESREPLRLPLALGTPSLLPASQELERRLLEEVVLGWEGSDVAPEASEMVRILWGFTRVRALLAAGAAEALHWGEQADIVSFAHDMRSPLTSILFLIEVLRNGQSGSINDLQHRQLGIAYSAALNLVSLANNVIELQRPAEQPAGEAPRLFSVPALIDSIADVVEPLITDRGIQLHRRTDRLDQRLGDPVTLSRVLLNLATNALKYTEQGSITIEARALAGALVEFAVQDTGPGIDAASMPYLFQPFHRRASGSRLTFDGHGLGLAICRKLLHAMGSELRLETTLGKGSRFFFAVPLREAEG